MLPLHQTPILATPTGLEPVTSGVTGRRSTLLNYGAILVPSMGLEPIRDYSHQPLKLARLPGSPQEHIGGADAIRTHAPAFTDLAV